MTQTAEVGRALAIGRSLWPGLPASQVAARLIDEGARSLGRAETARRAERKEALRRTAGLFSGAYPEGYLAELREDWPT